MRRGSGKKKRFSTWKQGRREKKQRLESGRWTEWAGGQEDLREMLRGWWTDSTGSCALGLSYQMEMMSL